MEKQKLFDLIMASITVLFMAILITAFASLWAAYELYDMDINGIANNLPWIGLLLGSLEITNLTTWIVLKYKYGNKK